MCTQMLMHVITSAGMEETLHWKFTLGEKSIVTLEIQTHITIAADFPVGHSTS